VKNPAFVGAIAGTVLAALLLKAAGADLDPAHATPGITIGLVAGLLGGAACMSALRHSLRGAWSGFWQSTVGRWLIGRIAGAAVYAGLVAVLWKPAMYAVAYSAAGIVRIGGWPALVMIAPAFPWLIWVMALAGAWFLRTPAKIVIGRGSRPVRRLYRSLRMGGGGSAGFAGICEEWANRWRPGLILLGHSLFDRRWPVGVKDDRMMSVLGGVGAGKDETVIIPNLLLYAKGSAFVVDVKGQDAAVTAEARRKMGQAVHVLDPMGTLKQGTAHLNPLDALDPASNTYVEDIYAIVDALVIAGHENNRFWSESARTVIAGAIDYAVRRKGEEFVPPADFMEEENVND
jgi:type IV secretory pathway TraG/TraD family ATPase VirD4